MDDLDTVFRGLLPPWATSIPVKQCHASCLRWQLRLLSLKPQKCSSRWANHSPCHIENYCCMKRVSSLQKFPKPTINCRLLRISSGENSMLSCGQQLAVGSGRSRWRPRAKCLHVVVWLLSLVWLYIAPPLLRYRQSLHWPSV